MKIKGFSAYLLIVLITLILAVSANPIPVQAATSFSGVISTDTTWTLANSPYTLTGNVLVSQGITLTIEPGVTVNLNSYYIKVDGTLNAQGTSDNKISLTHDSSTPGFDNHAAIEFTGKSSTWNESTKTGCIISNAIVTNSQPGMFFAISIKSAGPKICNSTILSTGDNRAIYISNDYGNSAPIIINNVISSKMEGITVMGLISDVNRTSIINNTILDCEVGIEVYGGNPLILGNLIVNNTGSAYNGNGGIRIDHFDAQPTIVNNTIVSNTIGLNFLDRASAILINNTIQNKQYNIYLYPGLTGDVTGSLNATYNYWGTTDTQIINQTIYDYKYDFNLGNVTFTPFLDMPNPAAPTYVNATAGIGGSISSSGVTRLNCGDSKTFTISPSSGYHIADVLVNGSSVSAVTTYTIQNIQGATTISAIFTIDPTPTPTATPTSQPTTNPNSNPTQSPDSSPSPSPTIPEFPSIALIAILLVAASGAILFYRRTPIHK